MKQNLGYAVAFIIVPRPFEGPGYEASYAVKIHLYWQKLGCQLEILCYLAMPIMYMYR